MNPSREPNLPPPADALLQAQQSPATVSGQGSEPSLEARLDADLGELETLARSLEGQPQALLALLRRLEQLHRSIQDGPFRASLPADRNGLFQVLSEMERSGGWPYIPRLQLRTFLDLLGAELDTPHPVDGAGLDPAPGPGEEPPTTLAA